MRRRGGRNNEGKDGEAAENKEEEGGEEEEEGEKAEEGEEKENDDGHPTAQCLQDAQATPPSVPAFRTLNARYVLNDGHCALSFDSRSLLSPQRNPFSFSFTVKVPLQRRLISAGRPL